MVYGLGGGRGQKRATGGKYIKSDLVCAKEGLKRKTLLGKSMREKQAARRTMYEMEKKNKRVGRGGW